MMKKTYINPTMDVIAIRYKTQMLAGSPNPTNEDAGVINGEYENALGRNFGFDDEE